MTEACNYYSISVTAPILTRCHNRAANYYRPCCCESRARMQHCGHTFAFPFPVRVCCCVVEPVEKKELRRGGSQLKRISAPAVRSRRAIFESPHHLDILNATPFPLHRSASPLSTRTRCLFDTRFVFPSFCPTTKSSFSVPRRGNCSSIDKGARRSLLSPRDASLLEILSLDSGSGRSSTAIVVVAR